MLESHLRVALLCSAQQPASPCANGPSSREVDLFPFEVVFPVETRLAFEHELEPLLCRPSCDQNLGV